MAATANTSGPIDSLDASTLTVWNEPALHHGFMNRMGGVSGGAYATYNLAEWVGDDLAAVSENRARWQRTYPHLRLARVRQVHGNLVHTIDASYDGARPDGDGMVTAVAGIALGIFSADCVPILMADVERGVAGAFHAGWRGTIAEIATQGVRAMAALGARPHEIRAALGPSIGPCCFEVDDELAQRFAHEIPHAREYSRAGRPGKAYLDLRGIIRRELEHAGLAHDAIEVAGPCTRCANDRYFSRRGAGGAITGLQMSFIGFSAAGGDSRP